MSCIVLVARIRAWHSAHTLSSQHYSSAAASSAMAELAPANRLHAVCGSSRTRITRQRVVCAANAPLKQQRCEPCEEARREAEYMGLHPMVMDRSTAERYKEQVDSRWKIVQDDEGRLRIRKAMRTKNFSKALELFQRVGALAEAEGHHPDLHLEGWNNVTIELWTHARNGLSENDFIVAAKIDDLPLQELLSKKQPAQE